MGQSAKAGANRLASLANQDGDINLPTNNNENIGGNAPILVQETTISCEGKGQTGGHPRVFIKIDAHVGVGECPYCGQQFKLDPSAKISDLH